MERTVRDASRGHQHAHGRIHTRVACWNQRLGSEESGIHFLEFVSRHRVSPSSKWRTTTAPANALNYPIREVPSLVGYPSDVETCIATSFKLTLPSVFFGKATETSVVKDSTWTLQREML